MSDAVAAGSIIALGIFVHPDDRRHLQKMRHQV